MKVTEFLREYARECRSLARTQRDAATCRRLHHVADVYTDMLKQFFAAGTEHRDLPMKTIGRVKRFITIHQYDIDVAIKESVASLLESEMIDK